MVKLYSKRKLKSYLYIISLIILISFYQHSNGNIFFAIHEILRNTHVLSLVFFPIGFLIISFNLDSRNNIVLRYKSEFHWFEHAVKLQTIPILIYSTIFSVVSTLSILSLSLISGDNISIIDISLIYFMIDIAKLTLSLFIISCIIALIKIKYSRDANSLIFLLFLVHSAVLTIEMLLFEELVVIRPISDLRISIFGNLLSVSSYFIFARVSYLLCSYVLQEGMYND